MQKLSRRGSFIVAPPSRAGSFDHLVGAAGYGVYVCAPPGRRTVNSRAFARLARHCHVAAHHAGELAGDGETEPGAAEALRSRGIGLGELLKQLCLLLVCDK